MRDARRGNYAFLLLPPSRQGNRHFLLEIFSHCQTRLARFAAAERRFQAGQHQIAWNTKKRKEEMERLCSSFGGPSLRMESWRNERHFTTLALFSPLFRPLSRNSFVINFLRELFQLSIVNFDIDNDKGKDYGKKSNNRKQSKNRG